MRVLLVSFFTIFTLSSFSQNAFTFCEKSGDCSMTWEEFSACKMAIATTDKSTSISSFVVTVKKNGKKDVEFFEFTSKSSSFPKEAMEMINKLKKEKKLGDKIEISNVEVVQSGKAARKVNGMVITLTN